MILSVVIVNYNVKYFLEQCLSSVKKAIDQSEFLRGKTEVFVVDNASTDGSLDFLEPLFPGVQFILNPVNAGFSKANNLGLSWSSGEFILFLNPDTIVAEDSLAQCLSFFQNHENAGAVGVRMIDGRGNFLKESKRGFPSPGVAFFKMTGLAACFPSSRFFAAYYEGHLDQHANGPVGILSGAFMMVRKEAIEKAGGFDEQFFMYAEDIDLSYRIAKAGFQNFYLASTTIIHFKGESTRRDLRYIHRFYLAMNQFMKKHILGPGSAIKLFFLRLAVAIRKQFAAAAVGFQKKPATPKERVPLFITGDPDGIPVVRNTLQRLGIPITETEAGAGGKAFCEGKQEPWKSIIGKMDHAERKLCWFVHGSGTHAIVGSNSGNGQGEIIIC
jgi:GT2 family glycosyltransferase